MVEPGQLFRCVLVRNVEDHAPEHFNMIGHGARLLQMSQLLSGRQVCILRDEFLLKSLNQFASRRRGRLVGEPVPLQSGVPLQQGRCIRYMI